MTSDDSGSATGQAGRLVWLDALRVLACFGVVSLHIVMPVVVSLPEGSTVWWTAEIIMSLIASCVPVFVIISGALFLVRPCHEKAGEFFLRRFHFFGQVVFWTFFYLALRLLSEPALSFRQMLPDLWKGMAYYHLWFLYMIAGLYLVTPILCRFVRAVSAPVRILVVCFLLVISSVWSLAGIFYPLLRTQNVVLLFVPFVPYYLLGYELVNLKANRNAWRFWLIAFLTLAGFLALSVRLSFGVFANGVATQWLLGSFSPFVMLMGVCMFQCMRTAAQGRFTCFLASISPLTLGIYVLHPLFIRLLERTGFPGSFIRPELAVIVLIVAAFAWSALTAWAITRIPYARVLVSGNR